MFNLPTPPPPNLTEYLSFLYQTVGIPDNILVSTVGKATGGDTGSLIDLSQVWATNQWAPGGWPAGRYYVCDSTTGQASIIIGNGISQVAFDPPYQIGVSVGDSYQIVPDYVLATLTVALELVNLDIGASSPLMYNLAVYNLAADRLLNFAPNPNGQTFFTDQRTIFRIGDPTVGVPAGANDNGVGVSLLNPEQLKMLTLGNLQMLKTPYGRQYLAIAQGAGQTIWGLT